MADEVDDIDAMLEASYNTSDKIKLANGSKEKNDAKEADERNIKGRSDRRGVSDRDRRRKYPFFVKITQNVEIFLRFNLEAAIFMSSLNEAMSNYLYQFLTKYDCHGHIYAFLSKIFDIGVH
uniref:Uncharacterized protein n=1 Tax=Romanomermis culicivorax TaxID=13658 RepID=A0A915IS30_ROMCU